MSISTLSATTNETLNAYGRTAVSLIGAYRAGGHYVLGRLANGWEKFLNRDGCPLSSNQRHHLIAAQRELNGFYDTGINAVTDQSTRAVNSLVKAATDGVDKLSGRIDQADGSYVRLPIDGAIFLARPFAEAGRDVASLIAERAEKAAARIEDVNSKGAAPSQAIKAVAEEVVKPAPARRKASTSR